MSHFNNINVGVTGFVFDSRYTFTGLGYLAICWQKQWGINTGGAVQTSTLPIIFTNVFLAVASTSTEWCCPGCSATNTTVTTRAYQSNRPDVAQPNDVNWIVIGCQPQWGYATNNNGTWALNFNTVLSAVVTGSPGYPSREFCGFDFNYTVTGWSFNAGYGGPGVTHLYGIKATAIALGF